MNNADNDKAAQSYNDKVLQRWLQPGGMVRVTLCSLMGVTDVSALKSGNSCTGLVKFDNINGLVDAVAGIVREHILAECSRENPPTSPEYLLHADCDTNPSSMMLIKVEDFERCLAQPEKILLKTGFVELLHAAGYDGIITTPEEFVVALTELGFIAPTMCN